MDLYCGSYKEIIDLAKNITGELLNKFLKNQIFL